MLTEVACPHTLFTCCHSADADRSGMPACTLHLLSFCRCWQKWHARIHSSLAVILPMLTEVACPHALFTCCHSADADRSGMPAYTLHNTRQAIFLKWHFQSTQPWHPWRLLWWVFKIIFHDANTLCPTWAQNKARPLTAGFLTGFYYYHWSLLYSAILCSRADSLHLYEILHEWIAFYSAFFWYPPKWCTYSAGMAGATRNCCHLSTFCVHHTTMHHVTSCKATYVRLNCIKEASKISLYVCHLLKPSSWICFKQCNRICFKPCSRICFKLCSRICFKPCGRICFTLCGRTCFKSCSRIHFKPCGGPGSVSSCVIGSVSSHAVGSVSSCAVGSVSSCAVGSVLSHAVGSVSSRAVWSVSSLAVGPVSSRAVGSISSRAVGSMYLQVSGFSVHLIAVFTHVHWWYTSFLTHSPLLWTDVLSCGMTAQWTLTCSSHITGYGYADIVHCQTAVTVQVIATLTLSIVRQQSQYRLWLHWHHPLSDSSHSTDYGYTDITAVRQQSQYRLWLQWHHPLSDSSHNTGYGYTDIVDCQTAVTIQVMATLTLSTVRQQSQNRLWLHWHCLLSESSQTAVTIQVMATMTSSIVRKQSDSSHNTGYSYADLVHCEQPHEMLSARQHSNHPSHTACEAWHFRYVQREKIINSVSGISEENWVEERWQTIIVLWSILWNAKGLFHHEMPKNKKVYSTRECQILPWKKGLFYFAKGLFYLEMPKNKKVCSTLECQMQFKNNKKTKKWVSDR